MKMSCTSVWVWTKIFSPNHRNPLALAHHCNAVGCAHQKTYHIAECITILEESNFTERTGFQWNFNTQKSFRNLRMQSCVFLGWTRYLSAFRSGPFIFYFFLISLFFYCISGLLLQSWIPALMAENSIHRIYHKISIYLAWFCGYHTMVPCQQSWISTRLQQRGGLH